MTGPAGRARRGRRCSRVAGTRLRTWPTRAPDLDAQVPARRPPPPAPRWPTRRGRPAPGVPQHRARRPYGKVRWWRWPTRPVRGRSPAPLRAGRRHGRPGALPRPGPRRRADLHAPGSWTPTCTPCNRWPLSGIASRARLSDDGSLAATTTFVVRALLRRRLLLDPDPGHPGRRHVVRRPRAVHAAAPRPDDHARDRNIWGVTFAADDDTFYATVAWAGTTWLAAGSLADRTLTTLRPDAECPSLSPDGTRVAYKKRLGPAAGPVAAGRATTCHRRRDAGWPSRAAWTTSSSGWTTRP